MANLGIDLDGKRKRFWQILMTYFNMKYIYGKVKIYKTLHGWHFVSDVETNFEARYALGDDPARLELSERRYFVSNDMDDILFDIKYHPLKRKWFKREEITEDYLLNFHCIAAKPKFFCKCGKELFKKPHHSCSCGRRWVWNKKRKKYMLEVRKNESVVFN
ncbi:MAG: hypothetical protein QXQ24_05570 [Nitrososphaeria archaeon]